MCIYIYSKCILALSDSQNKMSFKCHEVSNQILIFPERQVKSASAEWTCQAKCQRFLVIMPIHYIGRTTSFSGKRLYDYLSRLKDWGVGRIVYRNVFFERYPEKTYYVITQVQPHMMDRMQDYNKSEFGEVRVFVHICDQAYRNYFLLIFGGVKLLLFFLLGVNTHMRTCTPPSYLLH